MRRPLLLTLLALLAGAALSVGLHQRGGRALDKAPTGLAATEAASADGGTRGARADEDEAASEREIPSAPTAPAVVSAGAPPGPARDVAPLLPPPPAKDPGAAEAAARDEEARRLLRAGAAEVAQKVLKTASRGHGGDAAPVAAEQKPPVPAACAVLGLVQDDQGAPVEEAVVLAYAWGDARVGEPVRTGPDGHFTLPHAGISDGRPHRLRIEHRRYRPREVGVAPRAPEDEPSAIRVVLEDGPSLTGVVFLPSGGPAEAAQVAVIGLTQSTVTDRDGRFSLPVLPPGQHLVTARMPEMHLAAVGRASIDADGFPPDERPLPLHLGSEAAIIASGLETLNPGLAPPRVEVWLDAREPRREPPIAAATPGPDGIVRFEALAPALYFVALAHPSIGYLTPEPVGVTLSAGERREVWLGRSGTAAIVLRARGPSGPPPNGVYSAWGDLGSSAAVISRSGDARIEGLPADRYFVFCNDQQGGLGRSSVRLLAGEVKTIDLELLKAGRCTGTLVDERGAPAVGARVTSDTEEGRIARESIVDASGKFSLEMLYPGRHLIRARLDGRVAERVIEVGVGEEVGPVGMVLGTSQGAPAPTGGTGAPGASGPAGPSGPVGGSSGR